MQHYETELKRLCSQYAGLSGKRRTQLETILMEGDLMEVAVDEVQQLWFVLQQDSELLVSFEKSGQEKGDEGGDDGKRVVRKRKEMSPTNLASTAGLSEGGPSKIPPSKKRKRIARSITPKSSPSPAQSNISTCSKNNY